MAHLLNVWPAVFSRLREAEGVLLLFDYDGTLTPIVSRPEEALLPDDVRSCLELLAAKPGYVVGIVSGRSIDDLLVLANIPGLVHAGNHGMEIRGAGLNYIHPGAVAAREILDKVQIELSGRLAHIPGIIVEHKGLTLTVHFRSVQLAQAEEVQAIADSVALPYVESGELGLTRGKMVVEVRPAIPWNKGSAIEKIRRECGSLPFPVYFGDDRTDEDGFAVVQEMGGIAVFVGSARQGTVALHQLDSPREVADTLQLLLDDG